MRRTNLMSETERKDMKARTKYLLDNSGLENIYDIYEDYEFSEVTGSIGGDPLRIRVYGTIKDGFKMYEK